MQKNWNEETNKLKGKKFWEVLLFSQTEADCVSTPDISLFFPLFDVNDSKWSHLIPVSVTPAVAVGQTRTLSLS